MDGTGDPPRPADVAIVGETIVAVGADLPGEATRAIDAAGQIVTPGFVDVHTHYDGQVTWDDLLEPSSGHGVTTVVMGNCGVGFAPVRPGTEEWLVQLMEGHWWLEGMVFILYRWRISPVLAFQMIRLPSASFLGAGAPATARGM